MAYGRDATRETRHERVGTVRWEFQVGLLAWSIVPHVANYARAHGLDVHVYSAGWLIRRGWLVARGAEPQLDKLMDYITRTEREYEER